MIDLTVYFLFFIAFTSGAVIKREDSVSANSRKMFELQEDILIKSDDNDELLFRTTIDDSDEVLTSMSNSTDKGVESQDADPWSVIWYLGAFSGLITFFLVVTCSEWCCGNHLYTRHYGANHIYANSFTHTSYRPPETPPPPYHLFAPPSYNDSVKNCQEKQKPPKKSNIFIIPIHRNRRNSTT